MLFLVLLGYFFLMQNSFPKKEHLYGVKAVETLHTQGKAFIGYPFRVVFLMVSEEDETIAARAMVSVSKKRFKSAVARNRIKRLIRESYRLNKPVLVQFATENKLNIHLSFQYVSNEMPTFGDLNEKMNRSLDKLIKIISNLTPSDNAYD
ncbi:MAG: ribonuclease P protein component [Paludibacteraceae bacterium]